MAQVNGTDTQAAKTTAASLFASLRSSFSLDSVKGGLFANLMAQSKASEPLPSSVADNTSSAQVPDSHNSTALTNAQRSTSSPVDHGDEDEARVRDLLKQVRDDINQLRADRKRADDAAAADKKTDAKTAKSDDDKPVAAEAKSDEKIAVKDEGKDDAKTDVVAAAESDIKEETKKPLAEAVKAAAVEDTVTTDCGSDNKAAKDILAELVATEQALAIMLQKMQQDKAGALQVAGAAVAGTQVLTTGTVDAVKNASGKSAVKDKTDAGLAAAFGADASSAKIEPEKSTDSQETSADKKVGVDAIILPKITDEKAVAKEASNAKAIDLAALFRPANNDALPVAAPVAAAVAAPMVAAKAVVAEGEGNAALRAVGTASATANPAPIQAEGARTSSSYDFASQLSAQRATKGGTAGLPPAVEQVALQLHKMVKDGNDQMTLQLRPADLGRIEIKLEFSKDGTNTVKGTVIADSQATLDMLQKDSGGLQRALQDAGLRADSNSLQFSLRDGQQNGFAQNMNGQSQSGHNLGGYRNALEDDAELPAATADETYYVTPGRVNLRV